MYSQIQEKQLHQSTIDFLNLDKLQARDYLRAIACLQYHEWKYYVQNEAVISDQQYDLLFQLVKEFEAKHPASIHQDSPTQRVGNDSISEFETVSHLQPMLSLDNTYNLDDLNDFDQRIKKLCSLSSEQELEYLVEPKFDGGSISVVFENDQMVRAATRGDGMRGDEITLNAKTIKSLPLKAKFSSLGITKAELRGEAIISKSNFAQINIKREQQGLTLLANARNASTGVLRVKDPKETASRNLDLFIFQFSFAENQNRDSVLDQFQNQNQSIEALAQLGFKVATVERKLCKGIQQVFDFIQQWVERRDQYHYELDGMVVKLNDFKLQELCGYTSHHPRWAVAFKFQAKQASSKLLAVEFQVGKIGSITPVAKIEPVPLAGVTVSSISLHNEDFILSKDLHLGDTVLVERAGDVIPYIVKSFPELRPESAKAIRFPTHCPSCDSALIKEKDQAAWRCVNPNCPAQLTQKLIHHVSKDAMDIDGLGSSLIERFAELGMIRSMADIYRLDYQAISQLEGMGQKSSEKLKLSIEKAKKNPIHRVLHGLCIHHVGKKVSKLIAEQVHSLLDLQHWPLERYIAIKDVGPVVGENMLNYFSQVENIAMLKEMKALGVNMIQTEEDQAKQISDGVFSGKTILFTGSLQSIGRTEAQELAEQAGAKNLSAVSSKLNILVVGTDAGSKLKKAQEIPTIQIMTEEEFLKAIGK